MKSVYFLLCISALCFMNCTQVMAEECLLTYQATGTGYTVTGATNKSTCTSAHIPSTYEDKPVIKIKDGAFYGANQLVDVTIADSVTSIGSQAFRDVPISNLIIPSSVKSIGTFCFIGSTVPLKLYCPSHLDCVSGEQVTQWNVEPIVYEQISDSSYNVNGQIYSSLNQVCATGHQCFVCGKTNVDCWADFDEASGALNITGNGTMIRHPWQGLASLIKSADINGVKNIVADAFFRYSLEEVTIGDSVESIGYHAFFGTENLGTVIVPPSVTSVGNTAFTYSAQNIYCPEGLDCQTNRTKIPYSKIGDYYSMGGKMYRNLTNMMKGIEMKRIYTVLEANEALGKNNRNTFSIRYR